MNIKENGTNGKESENNKIGEKQGKRRGNEGKSDKNRSLIERNRIRCKGKVEKE